MRILVIEDDPAVSHSLALMLRSETCSIHTTDLGEEGVDLAKLKEQIADLSWGIKRLHA